jgi:nucleotide-binding universal stress UspA family protein
MFNRILVTLDSSELAERAIAPALELARKFESEIILLRVPVVEAQIAVAYGMGVPYEADLKRSQEEAEGYLYSWKMKLLGSGVNIRTEVVSGAPSEVILDVADAEHADLIVMSTHGRSGLSRLMYGSVAESVLRGSQIPVLLIPVK